ncbi:MAG: hypothetical protein KA538_12710, partial [Azonexus sp.]|nr:hypothetical protein [Azonexus sp.]
CSSPATRLSGQPVRLSVQSSSVLFEGRQFPAFGPFTQTLGHPLPNESPSKGSSGKTVVRKKACEN